MFNYSAKNKISPLADIKSNAIFFQPKLSINQPNDIYEQEADAMADKVMRMPDNEVSNKFFKPALTSVQRKCAQCEEEEKRTQRKEINNDVTVTGAATENYIGSLNGKGKPLTNEERSFFEPRFGYDFSNVKVHTDNAAAKSAQSINALAYTSGNNIVFNTGQYSPGTDSGKQLLAHELTHTMQQAAGISRHIQRAFNPGRCCNESETGADEWALVSNKDPNLPTVWQRLAVGECVGNPLDTDCEGMTCGGGFYTVQGWTTLLAPGTCSTPGEDDFFYEDNRWTPSGVSGDDAASPEERGSDEGNIPPGYTYGQ